MNKRIIPIVIVAVLIAVLSVSAINSNNESAAEMAESSLHEFLGAKDRDVTFKEVEDLYFTKHYIFTSKDGSMFRVDGNLKDVVSALFAENYDDGNTLNVLISMDEAEEYARKYIEYASGGKKRELSIIEKSLKDHGAFKDYYFIFCEVSNDVMLFNRVIIKINPSNGDVMSYNSINSPLNVSLNPKIPIEKAEEIAVAQYKDISGAKCNSKLIVDYPNGKEQKLIWFITVNGEPKDMITQGGDVTIDAMDGTVYTVNGYK